MRDDEMSPPAENPVGGTDDGDGLVFDGTAPYQARSRAPVGLRLAGIVLPIILAVALLLGIYRWPFANASPTGSLTLLADVPWAVVHIDRSRTALRLSQSGMSTQPMLTLDLPPGTHRVTLEASGFFPLQVSVHIQRNVASELTLHPRLTPDGQRRALDAINRLLDEQFAARVSVPAALWPLLGHSGSPQSGSIVIDDRFEASGLSSDEPTYNATSYLRPVSPASGTVGMAATLEEHTRVYNGCGGTAIAERFLPLLGRATASVVFSVSLGAHGWEATQPYALNPARSIYTDPDDAATPATPGTLTVLAAQTALAANLGDSAQLAGAVTPQEIMPSHGWAAGYVLSISTTGGTDSAVWYFGGGIITP